MDEAEEKIVIAMAKAAALADGYSQDHVDEVMWRSYEVEARRHYAMHKAMMEAMKKIEFAAKLEEAEQARAMQGIIGFAQEKARNP